MSSIDRLAAARAQRTQPLELSNMQNSLSANADATNSSLPTFLAEVASIQEDLSWLNDNVAKISAARTHYLNTIETASQEDNEKLETLTTETRRLTVDIKDRIQRLEAQPPQQDAQMRKNRIAVLRSKFLEAIQNYQRVEHEGNIRSKQRLERQVLIVKPDASPEEVAAVINGGGQQIFAQALTTSTRYGESRAAYREVQERQQDLQRMEKTLAELGQLFNDMGILVEQQDTVINEVENTAKDVQGDTGQALDLTKKAVVHARNYRRGRWICFIIFIVVICILALVLGLVFGTKK